MSAFISTLYMYVILSTTVSCFSGFTLLVGRQERHSVCKNYSGIPEVVNWLVDQLVSACSRVLSAQMGYIILSLSLSLSLSPRLISIFPGEPGLAGFIGAKYGRSCVDNWSYKTCRALVKSPPTNQHPTYFYQVGQ